MVDLFYNNYLSTIRFVPLNRLRRWSFWWSLHHLEMYLCCDFGGVELLLLETWRSQVKLLRLFIVSDSENPWKTYGELYLTCCFFGFYCLRYNFSNQNIFIEIAKQRRTKLGGYMGIWLMNIWRSKHWQRGVMRPGGIMISWIDSQMFFLASVSSFLWLIFLGENTLWWTNIAIENGHL